MTRILKRIAVGNKLAVLRKNDDEFFVEFFHDGVHLPGATYYTNDKADAIGTANAELAREWTQNPVDRTVQLVAELSDEFCMDVMSTAIEGGSNYWGEFRVLESVERDGIKYARVVHALDIEEAEKGHFIVTMQSIRDGIKRILTQGADINAHHVSTIGQAAFLQDAGDIDADEADCILQFALFNELVYG